MLWDQFCVTQVFTITLVEVSGGASIGADDSVELRIVANDKPFGVVAVSSNTLTVDEEDQNNIVMFTINRT